MANISCSHFWKSQREETRIAKILYTKTDYKKKREKPNDYGLKCIG